jgi:hypothetical protein
VVAAEEAEPPVVPPVEPPPVPYGQPPKPPSPPRPRVTVGAVWLAVSLPEPAVVAADVPTPMRAPPATPTAVSVAASATRDRRDRSGVVVGATGAPTGVSTAGVDVEGSWGWVHEFSVTRTVHCRAPRGGCASMGSFL